MLYCIRDQRTGFMQSLNVQFVTDPELKEDAISAVIVIEDRLNQFKCERLVVTGDARIEKLVNLIQYSSETKIPVMR